MKKALNIISKILVVLLIVGAFAFNYFAMHKMGMSRHVYYMNAKYGDMFSLSLVNTIILLIALILLMLTISRLRKNKLEKSYFDKGALIVSMIALFYVQLFWDYKSTEAYYFVCYMLEFSVIIESLRVILISKSRES